MKIDALCEQRCCKSLMKGLGHTRTKDLLDLGIELFDIRQFRH